VHAAEDGTVDSEIAGLAGRKGNVNHLPGSYRLDCAVEIVSDLKAMGLDIGVTDDYVHLLSLLHCDYRP
jgi:hypothetical protein